MPIFPTLAHINQKLLNSLEQPFWVVVLMQCFSNDLNTVLMVHVVTIKQFWNERTYAISFYMPSVYRPIIDRMSLVCWFPILFSFNQIILSYETHTKKKYSIILFHFNCKNKVTVSFIEFTENRFNVILVGNDDKWLIKSYLEITTRNFSCCWTLHSILKFNFKKNRSPSRKLLSWMNKSVLLYIFSILI